MGDTHRAPMQAESCTSLTDFDVNIGGKITKSGQDEVHGDESKRTNKGDTPVRNYIISPRFSCATTPSSTGHTLSEKIEILLERNESKVLNHDDLRQKYKDLAATCTRKFINRKDLVHYKKWDIVPKGLQLNLQNRSLEEMPDLKAAWDKTLRDTSNNLLDISIEAHEARQAVLDSQISDLLMKMRDQMSEADIVKTQQEVEAEISAEVRAHCSYPPPHAGTSGRQTRNEYDQYNKTNCKYCNRLITSNKITSTHTHRVYHLRKNTIGATCRTTNIVYCITCKKCKLQYVGETKRKLMERLREHLGDISANRDTPVAKHFQLPGHSTEHVKIQIIEILHLDPDLDSSTTRRRHRERYWIYQLGTIAPLGINIKEY